jgi:superkiller protein 3
MKRLLYLLLFAFHFSFGQDASKEQGLIQQALDYEQKGDIDNAIKTGKKIFDINPGSYQEANSIAGLYGQLGKFADEITWAQKAIKINPKFSMGYVNLGNGYFGKGDVQKAEESYKKADSLDQSSPFPPYSLGVIEESRGNMKSAISYYQQSVTRDSTFENGYYNLAAAYANIQDFKSANINILKVLELNPNAKDAQEMHEHIIEGILGH